MYLELQYGTNKLKQFIHIDLRDDSIWVDTLFLPDSAFLCALCDGTPLRRGKCGKSGRIYRTLVNIDWVINEWGGDKEIVDLVKQRKEQLMHELPELKEKY